MMLTQQQLIEELAKRGIRLKVGGCGCCDSPWLEVQIDGKTVFDADDLDACVNSIDEEERGA